MDHPFNPSNAENLQSDLYNLHVKERWKADRDFPRQVRPRTTPETDGRSPTPLPPPIGTHAHPSPDVEMSVGRGSGVGLLPSVSGVVRGLTR